MLGEFDLIEGCVKNDRQAQESLYKLFASKMLGVCMRYAKDKPEAEDILQDGFVKVYMNINKFKKQGSLEGWVRRIMVNTALEKFRKQRHMYPVVETDEALQEIGYEISDNYDVQYLMKIINNLSNGYRVIFNLYAIEGFTHKEIAKSLNISEGTSKSQLARARKIIQGKIKATERYELKTIAHE